MVSVEVFTPVSIHHARHSARQMRPAPSRPQPFPVGEEFVEEVGRGAVRGG